MEKVISNIKSNQQLRSSLIELKAKTEEFKKRLSEGETLEDILVEAFATAREAAFRVIGENH